MDDGDTIIRNTKLNLTLECYEYESEILTIYPNALQTCVAVSGLVTIVQTRRVHLSIKYTIILYRR